MTLLDKLLKYARGKNASDLHVVSGNYAFMRVNGDMIPIKEANILSPMKVSRIFVPILSPKNRKILSKECQVDFALEFDAETRYRVNVYKTQTGLAGAFRQIPTKIQTLEDLNAPSILKDFTKERNGLVLVCGPTGSGKSTTLAAMVDYRNTNFEDHIITIEEPLEFIHQSKKSLVNHREVGKTAKTFAQSLRGALREDPDVIMVGEMRDRETIHLALTAAETGHLVFATLHTSSAAKTIDRIIDVFSDSEKPMVRSMLSTSLRGVISQTLVKKKDGTGRIAVHEIMVVNTSVGNLIRENKIAQIESMMQIGKKYGMITLKDQAQKLLDEGIVDFKDIENILRKTGEIAMVSKASQKPGEQ
ncbi:type IV pilus twitching motility protein PilT [Pseudomonadota bacterium]